MVDQSVNRRVLFCRIGWCELYDGTPEDEPKGAMKYIKEGNIGHEFYNFKPIGDRLWGYVESSGFYPQRIDPSIENSVERLENVLVIFFAYDPNGNPRKVVGWYKNATTEWEPQNLENASAILPAALPVKFEDLAQERDNYPYVLSTKADDAVLLPLENRTFTLGYDPTEREEFGRKNNPGQASHYYPTNGDYSLRDPNTKEFDWIKRVINFVDNYQGRNLLEVNYPEIFQERSRVWRIRDNGGEFQEFFKQNSCIALGWPASGDLKKHKTQKQVKDILKENYIKPDNDWATNRTMSLASGYQWKFVHSMQTGDYVIAPFPGAYVALGRVTSDYVFNPSVNKAAPHIRKVEWLGTLQREQVSTKYRNRINVQYAFFQLKSKMWNDLLDIMTPLGNINPKNFVIKSEQENFNNSIDSNTFAISSDTLDYPELNVEALVEHFAELLPNIDNPSLIGIFGQWGRGKTYFVKLLKRRLTKQSNADILKPRQYPFVYCDFHAWKYQETEAIWAYLYQTILNAYLSQEEIKPFPMQKINTASSFVKLKDGISEFWRVSRLNRAKSGLWQNFITDALVGLGFLVIAYLSVRYLVPLDESSRVYIANIETLIKSVTPDELHPSITLSFAGLLPIITKSALIWKKFKLQLTPLLRIKKFGKLLGVQKEIQDEIRVLLKLWLQPKSASTQKPDKRLLLFIDDLDRCPENKILEIMDALRVMLEDDEIKKLCVVLVAVDERILRLAIDCKYHKMYESIAINNPQDKAASKAKLERLADEYMDKLFMFGFKLQPLKLREKSQIFGSFLKSSRKDQGPLWIENMTALLESLDESIHIVKENWTKFTSTPEELIEAKKVQDWINLFEYSDCPWSPEDLAIGYVKHRESLEEIEVCYEHGKRLLGDIPDKEDFILKEKQSDFRHKLHLLQDDWFGIIAQLSPSNEKAIQSTDQKKDNKSVVVEPELNLDVVTLPNWQAKQKAIVVTYEEETWITDAMETYIGHVTPRQVNTFFARYLFAKSYLGSDLKDHQHLIQILAACSNPNWKKYTNQWLESGIWRFLEILHQEQNEINFEKTNEIERSRALLHLISHLNNNSNMQDKSREMLQMLIAY